MQTATSLMGVSVKPFFRDAIDLLNCGGVVDFCISFFLQLGKGLRMQPLPLGESGRVWGDTISGMAGLRESKAKPWRTSAPCHAVESVLGKGGQRPPISPDKQITPPEEFRRPNVFSYCFRFCAC
jgi:hypothetical protein